MPRVKKTMFDVFVESLQMLTKDKFIPLRNRSEKETCRRAAAHLGLNVKLPRDKNNVCKGAEFLCFLSDEEPRKSFELLPAIELGGMQTDVRYIQAKQHWVTQKTPVGRSGMPIAALKFYPEGHQDIPEEWLIYHSVYDTIFKPRFVENPTALTNASTKALGLPNVCFVLTPAFGEMEPEKAEEVFNFLERYDDKDNVLKG